MAGGGTIQEGLVYGKLPLIGKKDWLLYYVEVSSKHFHIFEGNESPNRSRKHLQSLELHETDKSGIEGRDKKSEFKFYYDRGSGGRYVFKCQKPEQRQEWILTLQKLIQKREYISQGLLSEDTSFTASLPTSPLLTKVDTPTPPQHRTLPHHKMSTVHETPPPPPPHNKPVHKRDSGFVSGTGVVSQGYHFGGSSADGEISHIKSNSGDSAIVHSTGVRIADKSSSADGYVMRRKLEEEEEEDLSRYEWYWGPMNRAECGQNLKEKGQIGNFIVRKNDSNDFVMSFWRKDGIHHHRILKQNNTYQFERSAVDAKGEGIPDLLDTYMKHCTDKTIGPYGGQLYPTYDQAWNPPEIDFNKFQKVLNKKAEETGAKRIFKPGLEMADNTYGGMSLHQVKDAIEKTQAPLTPKETYEPPNSPRVLPTGPRGKVLPMIPVSKSGPKTATKPKKSPTRPQSSSGYVNYPIPSSPLPSSSKQQPVVRGASYENTTHYSEEDEDEQEVYVAPGELDEEDEEEEQPIYENHGPGSNGTTSYANVPMVTPESSLYQNINFDGKPHTPPRQIKPSPRVKTRQK